MENEKKTREKEKIRHEKKRGKRGKERKRRKRRKRRRVKE